MLHPSRNYIQMMAYLELGMSFSELPVDLIIRVSLDGYDVEAIERHFS